MPITYSRRSNLYLKIQNVRPLSFKDEMGRDNLVEALAGFNSRESEMLAISVDQATGSLGWVLLPSPQGNGFVIISPEFEYKTPVDDLNLLTEIYNELNRCFDAAKMNERL